MENKDTIEFTEEQVREALKGNYREAEEVLKDKDRTEALLCRIEEKLKKIPKVGEAFSKIPELVSMVRRFIRKEYTTPPIGTIIAIVAALLYFLSPIDLIPDVIPVAGYIDDAAVILFCLKAVGADLELYEEWRKKNYPQEIEA